MKTLPLLIEIRCEDLPPLDVSYIHKQAAEKFENVLRKRNIDFKDVRIFVTPRRIGIKVSEISSHQNPTEEKIKGPPERVALKDKKPTGAGLGFAKKLGVEFKDLKIEETSKGRYFFYIKSYSGNRTRDLLKDIVVEFLGSLNFPVTMRWPGYWIQFPRPIRAVLVKLGKNSAKFSLGNIKTSRTTKGHYIYADKHIAIDNVSDYQKIMKQNYVIADVNERKKYLEAAIERSLKYINGQAVKPDALLEEVNNSLEYPTAVRGRFPEKYLKIPKDIIEACLMHHQKYFPVENNDGKLMNYFIGVRDGISEFLEPIRQGYEKVLIARLEDADFFLRQDRQQPLHEYVEKLKGIEFTRGLGTLHDKTKRCEKLSKLIAKFLNKDDKFINTVKRIADLSKADLTTQVISEFPELEGKIGRLYAEIDGEEKKVCEGIYQHYMPRTFEDDIPKLEEAAVVGIADRIDTLVGNMGMGVEATGSQDPFGMRRTCRGLIRILVGKKWRLDLREIMTRCEKDVFKLKGITFEKENISNLQNFVSSQMQNFLEEKFNHDIVRCIMNSNEISPCDLFEKAKAVEKIKKSKGFDSLVAAFKRINNILKQAGEKNINIPHNIDLKKLREREEKELSEKFNKTKNKVEKDILNKDFTSALKQLASLRAVVDDFFDHVLVMDQDKSIMENRLAILKNIVDLFFPLGDISKLEAK